MIVICIIVNTKTPKLVIGPGEIPQLAKCVPSKHEDLDSDPQNPHKKMFTAECAYNSSSGGSEAGGSLGLAGQLV